MSLHPGDGLVLAHCRDFGLAEANSRKEQVDQLRGQCSCWWLGRAAVTRARQLGLIPEPAGSPRALIALRG